MTKEFSQVLASMRPTANSSYQVTVPPDWLQGRTVFGGMQMALAVRAMRAAMPGVVSAMPLRSAQMTFIGPLLGAEPVELRAETLRCGRSTAHSRCDLIQGNGAVASSVVGIFGVPRVSQFVRELPAPDPGCRPDELQPPPGLVPAFTQHFEARWAVGDLPYSGHPDPRSMIFGRLRDRQCGPEDALLALADMIPTPVLSMLTTPAPASSLSWMIEVLRDPQHLDCHAWALIDTDVRAGTDGYLSQTSVLYGADGHAYSVSHQTVGVFG